MIDKKFFACPRCTYVNCRCGRGDPLGEWVQSGPWKWRQVDLDKPSEEKMSETKTEYKQGDIVSWEGHRAVMLEWSGNTCRITSYSEVFEEWRVYESTLDKLTPWREPLKASFECEWARKTYRYNSEGTALHEAGGTVNRILPLGVDQHLEQFIGKRTRVQITEIL